MSWANRPRLRANSHVVHVWTGDDEPPTRGASANTPKETVMLQGYKTYIVAAVVAVIGVLGLFGITIPGVNVGDNWFMLVLNALGLGALRAGIASK